ncbi:MAG: hypothetical protein VXX30_02150, partial [Planctomycetota bacterium]|nr:hypothetical protein [Planctomycetota bacterium]
MPLNPASTSHPGQPRSDGAVGAGAPDYTEPIWQTPAMRQYVRFKTAHPECLLLFRMGDFYELFGQDAVVAHEALGIT